MADKFKAPTMDWSSPGDLHKRFKLFKQKCQLIFDGPLDGKEEDKKARLLLLWAGDKGLEIYNTASWATEEDNLKVDKILEKFEQYTKPQSNQILARYQLRCLKQDNMPLEEFITKARTLVDDAGYNADLQEEMLRDTLVFGITSDKVRQDAISKGNSLTFKQVYDLAKTEESTKSQMQAITQGTQQAAIHEMKTRKKPPNQHQSTSRKDKQARDSPEPRYTASKQHHSKKYKFKFEGCFRCGNKHTQSERCPAARAICQYCKKEGHFKKVCMKRRLKQVNEIVQSPGYKGEDIYLQDDGNDTEQSSSGSEQDYEDSDDSEIDHITVSIGSIASSCQIDNISEYPDKLFTTVRINDKRNMMIKIDTGADACVLTTDDLQALDLSLDLQPCQNNLKGYGGCNIENLGSVELKVTFKGTSISTKFNIVSAPGHPSIIGCQQAQSLGMVTINIEELTSKVGSKVQQAAHLGTLTKSDVLEEYKDCFDGIGRFPGEKYHIKLVDNPTPVIHPPRTVPVHILPLYKEELDKMIQDDIVTEVTEPTEWVNSIVCNVTEMEGGKKKVRLCLDPKDLNENIQREHYYTRTIEEILPQLHGKKLFSVADTRKGYWHVELDHESSMLCTFNTPFGRYRFKRLPFGVRVSQDVFQRKLDEVYKDIDNVTNVADDIIIFGSTQEEHDRAFARMLDASRANNVSLNSEKLQFKQSKVKFFGYSLSSEGISPTTDKLSTIKNITTPTNLKELQSLLGIITYLNRFSRKLADLTSPLRELTKKNVHFKWEQHHQTALENIKKELCSSQVLSYYDPNPDTTTILQCDASMKGLGAWLRQIDQHGNEKIVAMASRSLTDAESRYSNIERECLAVTFGLEKFEYYLLGRQTLVETDHSPLEQIFKKNVSEVPTRLQRLILRCLKFDVEVKYKRGQSIPVADALSRVCINTDTEQPVPECNIDFLTAKVCPVNLESIRSAAALDPTMCLLKTTIYQGWPTYRNQCPEELWDYWNFRCDLVLENGLIIKGDRVLIPTSLRKQVIDCIHTGHQGETKCLLLARQSVYWPGMTSDIREAVRRCVVCNKHQPAQPKLPLMQPDLPTRPWEKIGADLFHFKGSVYLMIVDYYSRFPVIRQLNNMQANTVSAHFTSILSEYGIPSTIQSDFGSQFVSESFKQSCRQSGVNLIFSSPYHHQTNGLAEKNVGICKTLWIKALESNQCPYTAMWIHRITPIDELLPSPYELLTGRKPKSLLPSTNSSLKSKHPQSEAHQQRNAERQATQARFYNQKAGKDQPTLADSQPVYVRNTLKNIWEPGKVITRPDPDREPRTYAVKLDDKVYTRTRQQLRPRQDNSLGADHSITLQHPIPEAGPAESPQVENLDPLKESESIATASTKPEATTSRSAEGPLLKSQTTRYGRVTRIPQRFKD